MSNETAAGAPSVPEPGRAVAVDPEGDLPERPLQRIPDVLDKFGRASWLLLGIVLVLAGLYWTLGQVRTLLAPLVVAVVIGMLCYPLVDRLQRRGVPRPLGASFVLLGIVGIVLMSGYLAVRGVVDQSELITEQVTNGWAALTNWLDGLGVDIAAIRENVENILGGLGSGAGGLVTSTFSSLGFALIGFFIGLFLLYYLLKDWHVLTGWVAGHMGVPKDLGDGLISDATGSIRQYFIALTYTSIPIAIIIGATMWVLGLPLAFTVALVTFVTAYIPYIGAIVSGAFACFVALGAGGVTDALIVLAMVLLTQNVLQTFLLARLASSQLSLHPIVTLGSTIVGATFFGILGATLSAPVVAMLVAANARIRRYRWRHGRDAEGLAASPDGHSNG
jgi:predicted PurR-regulated permease PerM